MSAADADDARLRKISPSFPRRYNADRLGVKDYALASAGAFVVRGLTSKAYTPPGRVLPTELWHALGVDAQARARRRRRSVALSARVRCFL